MVAAETVMAAEYDRAKEIKAFDETKGGVKGLVDAGITQIPRHFYSPPEDLESSIPAGDQIKFKIPVINLDGVSGDSVRRKEIVEKVREASETWGIFQIVNHGIPVSVMEGMKDGVKKFHEQDRAVREQFYTRDPMKPVVYNSNPNLYTSAATNWRDTFTVFMAPNPPKPEDLPEVCRDILIEYSKQVMKVGILLFELLSEALGLNSNYLKNIDCAEGLRVLGHYYPACPQPGLTLGATKHSDNCFLTVLLQDHVGGLQFLCDNHWVDISYEPGSLLVNIGDLLQLISNDRFKSGEHRVLANGAGPRISVAIFFNTGVLPTSKLYGPIKELLSEKNPPKYRETTARDYHFYYREKRVDGTSALPYFRV